MQYWGNLSTISLEMAKTPPLLALECPPVISIYLSHILSHLSFDEHLDCYVLAIVNSAMNMYVFEFEFSSFLDIYSRVGFLGHMIALF